VLQFPQGRDSEPSGKQEDRPITIRRSPAEFYIRYRLIAAPDADPVELAQELEREMVFSPAPDYLPRLRAEMQPLEVFRPYDKTHLPSQQFLVRWGVWSYFHPHTGTRQAMQIFENERARQQMEILLSGPNPDGVIIDVVKARMGLPLGDAGLREFRHYFWNTSLLRLEELSAYVTKYFSDKNLVQAMHLTKNQANSILSLSKMGVQRAKIDDEQTMQTMRQLFELECFESSNRKSTMGRTTAMRMALDGYLTVTKELSALAAANGNLTDEVERFRADVRAMDNPTLLQLTEGQAPTPVGMLIHEEEVKSGGSKQG